MKDVDAAIRKALRTEENDLLKDLNEPGMFEQMFITMRRAPRWASVFVMGWSIVFTAAAVWFAVEFFRASETHAMIAWATGFLAAMLFVMGLKIWFWMQMNKYTMLREIKRLELQVARLVEQRG